MYFTIEIRRVQTYILQSVLLNIDEIIKFYVFFPKQDKSIMENTGQYIIYKQKMHIKTRNKRKKSKNTIWVLHVGHEFRVCNRV